MRVFVASAAGETGRHLVPSLVASGRGASAMTHWEIQQAHRNRGADSEVAGDSTLIASNARTKRQLGLRQRSRPDVKGTADTTPGTQPGTTQPGAAA